MTQAWTMKFSFTHKAIPVWMAFLFLFALDIIYNGTVRHLSEIDIIWVSLLNATLYTTILVSCLNIDLAKITICYLALPYLLFFPGWLNVPTATLMTGIFVYCTYHSLKNSNCSHSKTPLTTRELFAFCLIIAWVNISGSGGYGYQSWDYVMHNSRLNDLINKPWPVHYGKDLNLVYYIGYYLPSAAIGKVLGDTAATRSMFVWTLLGVTLALRWVSILSSWKLGAGLVTVFIFFGPMDAAGLLWLLCKELSWPPAFTMQEIIGALQNNPDSLDFWASSFLNFFVGNFLSNTFQLYWAPQHIIPGWLCLSLITHLFFSNNKNSIIFIFCLLNLWSPLVMLSMTIFVIAATLHGQPLKNRDWLTLNNTGGAIILTGLFLFFYLGGSALINYSVWTLRTIDLSKNWDVLVAFYLFSWGLYAVTLANHRKSYSEKQKIWFASLIITMLFLPIYIYGEYSDLLCRGSAPVMFLLMIFLLQFIKKKWSTQQKASSIPLLIFMVFGCASAALQIHMSITHYGEKRAVIQVTEYKHASENLGSDSSFFARFFRGEVKQ